MGLILDFKHGTAASYLVKELVENGFAEKLASDQCELEWESLGRLSDEERGLLGLPLLLEAKLVVSLSGLISRAGAQVDWCLQLPNGHQFDRMVVQLPFLRKAGEDWMIPADVCRGIELVDAFRREGRLTIDDQYELVARLQELEGVELPSELGGKSFRVPEKLDLTISTLGDYVELGAEIPGLTQEEADEFTRQIDRKARLVRSPNQLPSSIRIQNDEGYGVNIAIPGSVKEDLVRLHQLRSQSWTRREFVRALQQDPNMGFGEGGFDMTKFSNRVMRVGLFVPHAEMVLTRSEHDWLPSIETRGDTGEIKRLLIQSWADLEIFGEAIAAGQEVGDGLIEFKGYWFSEPAALELYELCKQQLAATEKVEPIGRLIPIVDDEAEAEKTTEEWAEKLVCEIPPDLAKDVELFPHQRTGVAWMQSLFRDHKARGGLLADDMGLGKTIQVLTFIHWHRQRQIEKGTNEPYLLVAPVALLENWERECQRFFPEGIATCIAHGRSASLMAESEFCRNTLIITNYETVSRQILRWATIDWAVVALDEAQQIKNSGTIKSQAARALKSSFNIAMTGTPVENRVIELWSIMDFVDPGVLGSERDFRKRFERQDFDSQIQVTSALREALGLRMLRRLKVDVLKALPPKYVYPDAWSGKGFHDWAKQVTRSQDAAYREFREQYDRDVDAGMGPGAVLNAIQRFRAVVDHPFVADGRLTPILESSASELIEESAKLQVTMQLLADIKAYDEKVIVFSALRLSQQLLAKVIAEQFGVSVPIINGETPVSAARSKASRQAIVDAFNEQTGFAVLVLSPLAAGVGLNITSANHVIHFTRHWNPAKESQATDRAYRIGQVKPVHVYLPMSLSDEYQSFDSILHQLLARKYQLAEQTLAPTTSLTDADFIEMLKA